jgi:ApbE superfamily uncharacterized protein (UPF0280 family)
MSGATAYRLGDGSRLYLQHGPIDLIIGADGARDAAFERARARFETILQELVDELAALRQPLNATTPKPQGQTARRMDRATRPFSDVFVTRMAAVAGAVADTILAEMCKEPLHRAYVNNGGDIALHLADGQRFSMAMTRGDGADLGRVEVSAQDNVGGVATSGRHGRSLSLGIADSVTVLAKDAATADVAATLIANAVDLPGHAAIARQPATRLQPDSDLGERLVATKVGEISQRDASHALHHGAQVARAMQVDGRIVGAALFLCGQSLIVGPSGFRTAPKHRITEHA